MGAGLGTGATGEARSDDLRVFVCVFVCVCLRVCIVYGCIVRVCVCEGGRVSRERAHGLRVVLDDMESFEGLRAHVATGRCHRVEAPPPPPPRAP